MGGERSLSRDVHLMDEPVVGGACAELCSHIGVLAPRTSEVTSFRDRAFTEMAK